MSQNQNQQPESETQAQLKRLMKSQKAIQAANARVLAAYSEWDDAKKTASELKKDYDQAVANLQATIAAANDSQIRFDFNEEEEEPEPAMSAEDAAGAPVSVLGITDKETELLEECGIETVEDLEHTISRNPSFWHKSIPGFAKAKADKICDLLEQYRGSTPVPTPAELVMDTSGIELEEEPSTETAINLCTEILAILDDIPEEGDEFRESVEEKTNSIMEWINEHGRVTPAQMEALENMHAGAQKWLEHQEHSMA